MTLNVALAGVLAALLSACSPKPEQPAQAEAPAVAAEKPAEDAPVQTSLIGPAEPAETAGPCDYAQSQGAMTECWAKQMRIEEERVDAARTVLDGLAARRGSTLQQKLQEDQSHWLAFVEGHCGVYGELYGGGSASPMTIAVCRQQLAQTRLQQLTKLTAELDR